MRSRRIVFYHCCSYMNSRIAIFWSQPSLHSSPPYSYIFCHPCPFLFPDLFSLPFLCTPSPHPLWTSEVSKTGGRDIYQSTLTLMAYPPGGSVFQDRWPLVSYYLCLICIFSFHSCHSPCPRIHSHPCHGSFLSPGLYGHLGFIFLWLYYNAIQCVWWVVFYTSSHSFLVRCCKILVTRYRAASLDSSVEVMVFMLYCAIFAVFWWSFWRIIFAFQSNLASVVYASLLMLPSLTLSLLISNLVWGNSW